MDFIIAPKATQFTLSTVLQTFSSLILLVYISLALGCGLIAVFSDFVSRIKHDAKREEFAAKCAQIATGNFGVGFLFGVVPVLSIWLSYTQFLYGLHTPVVEYFLWAGLFNLVGLLFLNKYRDAFHVKKIVHGGPDAQDLLEDAQTATSYSGLAGVVFLLIGSYFFIGATAIALDPGLWEHGFIVIFSSIQVWLKFSAFVCGALGIAGLGIIFFFKYWAGGLKHVSEEAKDSALLSGATLAIVFIPLYSVFTGLHLKFIPRTNFTISVIVYSAIAIILLFIVLHMVYYALVHKNNSAGHMGFVLVTLAVLFIILADNDTRQNALRKHTHQLEKSSAGSHGAAKH